MSFVCIKMVMHGDRCKHIHTSVYKYKHIHKPVYRCLDRTSDMYKHTFTNMFTDLSTMPLTSVNTHTHTSLYIISFTSLVYTTATALPFITSSSYSRSYIILSKIEGGNTYSPVDTTWSMYDFKFCWS